MYLSSPNISIPTPFSPTPVHFSDINTAAQQQQIHYTLLNFNAAAAAGLISPIPILGSSSNTNGTQSSTQTNESSQQTTSQSNSTLNHLSTQPILIENLYNSVLLREKNPNQSYDPRKTRKRLSDPIYSNNQQPLQPLIINQQQNNLHPLFQTNQNLSHDLSNQTLNRRRSLRFIKVPTILQTIPQQISIQHESQKLLVVRHAERVDSTFGAGWLDQVFDKTTGIYRRINLNLPKKMVTRRDLKDFLFDPPLTELGLHECKMVGEELRAQGIEIHHIYASPALRCVQTADKILEGLQLRDEISIRIEPCLFEFLKWYPVVPVKWPFLDLDELTKNGYNVDKSYKPFYPIESLRKDEDELMYYTRSHFIATSILKNHQNDGGNLLLVGHVILIQCCFLFLYFCFSRHQQSKFVLDN
jgi:broad specificity phosphatase PhoE